MERVVISELIVPEDDSVVDQAFWMEISYINAKMSMDIGIFLEVRERVIIFGGPGAHGITFFHDEFVLANKMWRLLQEIHNSRCDKSLASKEKN